jgi:hypothetical protein
MSILKSPAAAPQVEVASVGRDRWRLRLPTVACFGIAILTFIVGLNAGKLGVPGSEPFLLTTASVLFLFATLVAAIRTLLGFFTLVQVVRNRTHVTFGEALVRIMANGLMSAFGLFVGYVSTIGFSRGRQLRRRGRVLLPSLRANDEWTDHAIVVERADAPTGLADQWRENGKTEHASVAAFARLTLDLMALGAPPELVAGANQDALDEIRHAQMCFSLATALDGRHVSPAPFPQAQRVSTLPRMRALALAQLAMSSLVDGALHEGVSARIIARLAKRCEDEGIRAMLRSIAADEGRHSAHGWDVVEWCGDQGGTGVVEALRGALRALPARMQTALPAAAADGGWERWGIHGHALEDEEYGAALRHVMERVGAMLRAQKPRAA